MSTGPKDRPMFLLSHPSVDASVLATGAFDGQTSPVAPPPQRHLSDILRPIRLEARRLRENRIVTLDRDHPASASFDFLRTKILRLARQNGWTTIGITSPTQQSGTTSLALNLALSFSHQTDHRTLLLELNLHRPRLASLLGDYQSAAFADYIAGGGPLKDALVRYGETLAIGAVGEPVTCAAEVLQASKTARHLEEIRQVLEPDIILVDAPPVLDRDYFQATLGTYDAVILVADTHRSLLADIDRCERELSEQTNVVGVVINRCRFER